MDRDVDVVAACGYRRRVAPAPSPFPSAGCCSPGGGNLAGLCGLLCPPSLSNIHHRS
jgi:hypothetical protein